MNGVAVQGDSPETSLGRQNSIECLYYRQGVAVPATSSGTSGRRTYEPLVIRKRVDRSSPQLATALVQNRVVEGTFKFFRLSPSGDGTAEQYYTTKITDGRIVSVTQFVTDVDDPGRLPDQPFEEVSFVFNQIEWTWNQNGTTYLDQIRLNGSGSFSSGSAGAGSAGAGSAATGSAAATGSSAAGGGAPPAAMSGDAASPELAPEPLRTGETLRRSRVATIVPLTEAESAAELAGPP